MTNYTDKSNFEINKLVAIKLGFEIISIEATSNFNKPIRIYSTIKDGEYDDLKDYCNSWADAGELIEKYKIELNFDDFLTNLWVASNSKMMNKIDVESFNSVVSTNPLRAVCECFLMMGDL